ncbi:PBSX family phage terminase large subunit [Fructobacillus cardui]|uniref:PBSX family phage terminase large subunit n=1 Tax=Fructobacillus cardui TaxID=2893170 RepID=UPI00200A5A7D|nr:PBSX family phage terminase large subunit [Fructobacillus cardui]MCK8628163.1 PBSX family phage terminase large subunit [Fructobacillus cardui]
MKLSAKQHQVISEVNRNLDDLSLIILYGAKRSGKTFLNNLLFLMMVANAKRNAEEVHYPKPQYILAGYTMANIQRNIIAELQNMGIKIQMNKYNEFELMGVRIVQTSTGSISGIGRIRGMTAFGAYINEASLCNRLVFDEIRSRCSGQGAVVICDTNPDNPEHWLLKDYIEKSGHDGIRAYHFEFDDNEMLDEGYKRNYKATVPTGMLYDRYIKGLWVSGEGAVYPEFNKDTMTITRDKAFDQSYERFMVGVDWGFNHPTAFAVIGFRDGKYTLMEEHVDSKKSIDHWINVAKDIQDRYGDIIFYCDTVNPEHIYDLKQHGIRAIKANKNVANGIEAVADKIHNNQFNVVYDDCPTFRSEIYRYVWGKNGDVVKENDHLMDAIRYVIYNDKLAMEQNTMDIADLAKLKGYM